MAEPAIESNGLPAFITAPVRVPAELHDIVPAIDTVSPLVSGSAGVERVWRMAFIRVPAAGAGERLKWESTRHKAVQREAPMS